jgi:hypothetical protein
MVRRPVVSQPLLVFVGGVVIVLVGRRLLVDLILERRAGRQISKLDS